MWLESEAVLHIVDLHTRFQNACFLTEGKSSEAVWKAFTDIWATYYTGYPSTIHCDQERSFVREQFASNCNSQGINMIVSGIDSHHSLGSGESFHRHLRRVFQSVRASHPTIDKKHALRLAIKAINDTAGPHGLVPSVLVFGSMPAFPLAPKNMHSQAERYKALATARKEMANIVAQRRVNDALRRKFPPATAYHIKSGDQVRVYREKTRTWDGPFLSLIHI